MCLNITLRKVSKSVFIFLLKHITEVTKVDDETISTNSLLKM